MAESPRGPSRSPPCSFAESDSPPSTAGRRRTCVRRARSGGLRSVRARRSRAESMPGPGVSRKLTTFACAEYTGMQVFTASSAGTPGSAMLSRIQGRTGSKQAATGYLVRLVRILDPGHGRSCGYRHQRDHERQGQELTEAPRYSARRLPGHPADARDRYEII